MANKASAPPALESPQDAICRVTGCGRIHADRVVKEIGSDAAKEVLKACQTKGGKPRDVLRNARSASKAPSPHMQPAENQASGGQPQSEESPPSD